MTTDHSTQATPHPPKQPFYLSPDDLQACLDIDENGIHFARQDSLFRLEFLATCLATELTQFKQDYPSITPAGLVLNVDVLLPVYKEVDESEFIETGNGEAQ